MNEAIITRQIMQNWKRQQINLLFWHKIADPTIGGDVTNARAVDVVACFNGVFIGMEFKIKKDDRAFPMKRIRTGQINTLCDIEKAGGVGLLMVVVYKGPYNKCVYAIPVHRWLEKVTEVWPKCKSIRIEDHFADCRIEPHRVGSHVHWEMTLIEEYANATRNQD